jgi:hypothetical protein
MQDARLPAVVHALEPCEVEVGLDRVALTTLFVTPSFDDGLRRFDRYGERRVGTNPWVEVSFDGP